MNETMNEGKLQVTESRPWLTNQTTVTDDIIGIFEKFYGFDFGHDKVEISSNPSTPAGGLCLKLDDATTAWGTSPFAVGGNAQYTKFTSADNTEVAYVSLCELFDSAKKCLVIAIYTLAASLTEHKHHTGHAEPPPTGVWMGTTSGGAGDYPAAKPIA